MIRIVRVWNWPAGKNGKISTRDGDGLLRRRFSAPWLIAGMIMGRTLPDSVRRWWLYLVWMVFAIALSAVADWMTRSTASDGARELA